MQRTWRACLLVYRKCERQGWHFVRRPNLTLTSGVMMDIVKGQWTPVLELSGPLVSRTLGSCQYNSTGYISSQGKGRQTSPLSRKTSEMNVRYCSQRWRMLFICVDACVSSRILRDSRQGKVPEMKATLKSAAVRPTQSSSTNLRMVSAEQQVSSGMV